MKTKSNRRRGVTLILVVFLMTILGGLLTLLATNGSYYYRNRQVMRVRNISRSIADSTAAYARLQMDTWKNNPPVEPINLDVSELLLPRMTASATVSFIDDHGRKICRVSAKAARGSIEVLEEIDIEIE